MYLELWYCICIHSDKLAAKAQKVAYYLLNKLGNGKLVQPGDRVSNVHVHFIHGFAYVHVHLFF